MGLVKVQKNKAYYKRLQVKYRRRRQGKTDYYARRKMVTQEKNKYNTPKYRLVVRITNKKYICQIVYATIAGDKVLCQAQSNELAKYGIPAGYTNYSAGYCTGLLLARRALTIVGLADAIVGVEEADAEEFCIADKVESGEVELERRPFKCILDVGLIRTGPGARIFGVLKGAVDGGLHVPHTCKKMPGGEANDEEDKGYTYDASAHLERIMGNHVVEFMEMLKEEDKEKYEAHFAKYIEADIEPDGVEDMYKEAHAKIRADPSFTKKTHEEAITNTRKGNTIETSKGTEYTRQIKMTKAQRVSRVAQKFAAARARAMADAEE